MLPPLTTVMKNLLHPQRSRVASCASHIFKPVVSATSSNHCFLGLPLPLALPYIPNIIVFSKRLLISHVRSILVSIFRIMASIDTFSPIRLRTSSYITTGNTNARTNLASVGIWMLLNLQILSSLLLKSQPSQSQSSRHLFCTLTVGVNSLSKKSEALDCFYVIMFHICRLFINSGDDLCFPHIKTEACSASVSITFLNIVLIYSLPPATGSQ